MALFRFSSILSSKKVSPLVPVWIAKSEQKVLRSSNWSPIFSTAPVTAFSRLFRVLKVCRGTTFCRKLSVMSGSSLVSDSNASTDIQPLSLRSYQVVVAATRDLGIGKDGKLPWSLPSDLKFFKEITMATTDPVKKNAVIMGRKTWENIPSQFRPLPGRLNVILTRSGFPISSRDENVIACQSILSALELLAQSPYDHSIERVFVIGGGQILREALNAPQCEAIHLTEIEISIECDTFIPPVDVTQFKPWYTSSPVVENSIRYCFVTYVRVTTSALKPFDVNLGVNSNGNSNSKMFDISNFSFLPKLIYDKHDEFMYLRLLQDIITNGDHKDDWSGTGTLSKFGCQMRFNLRKCFPLLTTKRIFWQGVVEELLWFISGSTNAKHRNLTEEN